MSHQASACICWLRKTDKIDPLTIDGLEEYMLSHPILVASILPNGELWCYTMTSFAKIGIQCMTQKLSKAELALFAPIATTKPHPHMQFQLELDRKLKTCGRPGCKETLGCEEGCSFTCSYVNFERPFKLPPGIVLPFLHHMNGDFQAIRLSPKSQEDITRVLKQYLSNGKAQDIRAVKSLPSESSKDKKTKLEVNRNAAVAAPQTPSSKYRSSTAADSSNDAPAVGSKPLGKVTTPANTCGLPGPCGKEIDKSNKEAFLSNETTSPFVTTHLARPTSEQNPTKMTLTISNKLREELFPFDSREQSAMITLHQAHVCESTELTSECKIKLESMENCFEAAVQQQAREQAKQIQELQEVTEKTREELMSGMENAIKIEELSAKVEGLVERKSTFPASFLSDSLPGIADLLAQFRRLFDGLKVADS